MDSSRGDSRYNLNYSMSSIGLSLADQPDIYGNPAAVAALGGRPPSGGLSQTMGGAGVGFGARSGGLLPSVSQCQTLVSSNANHAGGANQQRGIKRAGSDCYEDHHRGVGGGLTVPTLQGLESCSAGGNGQQMDPQQQQQQQQQQQAGGNVSDVPDDGYNVMQSKKSPPANGKKTKGRVKIKMEYIDNKLRRYTTFSKRKTGIMKKAYELSTLTGTQVMLLVASETGHVYTFATRKLQPMITSEAGKQLIQTCLNSPDPPSVGGGDQRMSATGFEETELSYNIADEDSKDFRLHMSSGNESDDSSDVDSPAAPPPPPALNNSKNSYDAVAATAATAAVMGDDNGNLTAESASVSCAAANNNREHLQQFEQQKQQTAAATAKPIELTYHSVAADGELQSKKENSAVVAASASASASANDGLEYPTASTLANIPQEVLLQLIQSGHLQLHNEEDGSGHQYVAIPLSSSTANLLKAYNLKNVTAPAAAAAAANAEKGSRELNAAERQAKPSSASLSKLIIKQEVME